MNSLKKGIDPSLTFYEKSIISKDTPTIFIHGVGLDHTMWYPQKNKFKNKNVIYYDILNHGNSKKGIRVLNFEKFNNQLNNLVDYLNIKKFNLVGFSLGSLIAQHFTSKNHKKIKKLVLIASVYKRSINQKRIVKNRFNEASSGKSITLDSINRWFTKSYLKKNPKIKQFFINLLEKKENSNFMPAYKLFIEADKYKLNFKNFKMPTLLITGEKEIGSTPRMSKELKNKIENSYLYIVKDAKHAVTIEKANEINQYINKFLFNN